MSRKKEMSRRHFIKASAAGVVGTGALAQAPMMLAIEEKKAKPAKIKEYRVLGRTGFKASDIGVGGVTPVGVLNALLDAGVNYIDSAESYGRGQSEKNIGEAIQGRDRKKIFITTKLVFEKDKPETKEMIIERFQT
jgi:diketogulonate reductase-like aldo/keto reductase